LVFGHNPELVFKEVNVDFDFVPLCLVKAFFFFNFFFFLLEFAQKGRFFFDFFFQTLFLLDFFS